MQLILTETAKKLEEQLGYSFVPTRATKYSSGYDIRACIEEPLVLHAGVTHLVPLGFKLHIGPRLTLIEGETRLPVDNVSITGFLLPRSGLGSNKGIVLGNLVGVIDPDYQEQWYCSVWNRTDAAATILPGQKIAQVVFLPTFNLDSTIEIVDEFTTSEERNGGFGSTGEF